MKLSDEEFALMLDLARRKAYEDFLSGNEASHDVWVWLRSVQTKFEEEAMKKEEVKKDEISKS